MMLAARTHCRRHCTHRIRTLWSRFNHTLSESPSIPPKQPRNPYPFPAASNPTPHQIFHLPPSASQNDIKTRYYDLVRVYHPDTAISQFAVDAEVAHSRFQAISSAYEVLRGRKPMVGTITSSGDYRSPSTAAWRAATNLGARSRPDLGRGGDDRWKDRFIVFGLIVTLGVFVAQTASTRRNAFADAILIKREREKGKTAQQRHDDSNLSAS